MRYGNREQAEVDALENLCAPIPRRQAMAKHLGANIRHEARHSSRSINHHGENNH